VAAVDHGPQAPSIAAARMAISCGVGINNAMASAINMLGDVHGGAGGQCVALYDAVAARIGDGSGERAAARRRGRCEIPRDLIWTYTGPPAREFRENGAGDPT
jgi:citrate synthase